MIIKLKNNWVDSEDNIHKSGTILDIDSDTAKELIDAEKAIESDGVVKEVKAEDMSVAVKEAVAEAMKSLKVDEVKEEVKIDDIETIEVVKDAPIWKDTGEFLQAVVKAGKGNRADERLYKSTGQNEDGADADGGFLVEHRIGNEIYKLAAQESVLFPKCDVKEVAPNSNGLKINMVNETTRSATTLFGGVRCYSPAEGVAKTPFKQAYSQVDIDLGKLFAVNYCTDELLQDRTALRSFIADDVAKSLAWNIDNDILHGTTNTAMQEIENNAATVRVTVAGANPTAAELTTMYVSMAPGCIARAEWYMSLSQYSAIMQLEDTSGRKLIQPNFEISPYGTLFGKKVNCIEQADVDANDTSIMFLDLSSYLVIKRGGIQEAQSMHVKFLEDEIAFRFGLRMGGSPKLISTVTLPDGTIISPFVTRD